MPLIVSTGSLIDELREHALLPADKLAELPHLSLGRCGDARALARLVLQRGWLTIYQVNQVLAGNAAQLTFGPYDVLDRLGQGGLSAVYKARHRDIGLLVALKVINPEVLACGDGRQQFLQEVEAMAALDHPNCVQFCDADQVGDTCFFAMEFIDGTDLGKLVRLGGPLPVSESCDYIRQAALGLQHAFECNLVHRDIKPVNLYLTHLPVPQQRPRSSFEKPTAPPKGKPLIKILDWGLAGLRAPRSGDVGQAAESVGGGVIGTADYLSPEQARDAAAVDIRGDIYSLGCSFYFLLTGQPPFPDGTLMQKIMQHQRGEPRPVEAFRGDVPAEVVEILQRMMAKQPEDRFQTPAALALALSPHIRGNGADEMRLLTPKEAPVPSSTRVDATPLPIGLGGRQGQSVARLAKGGKEPDDTSYPQPH